MTTSDCIVIGGGFLGLFTACELAQNGLSTVLIEKGALGQGASWAAGGILSPLYPWREPPELNELAHWCQINYPFISEEIMRTTGIDPEWRRSGMWVLGEDGNDTVQQWADKNNVRVNYLSKGEISPESSITGKIIELPDVAQVRTPRLIKALKKHLLKLGVVIKENTRVQDFVIAGQQIKAVKTNIDQYTAKQLVITSGAWSGKLTRQFESQLPVKPVRGQMICYRTEPGYLRHIIVSEGFYAIPRKDGLLLIGSTLEDVGFVDGTTQEARVQLEEVANKLLPDLEQFEIIHQWSGLRPGLQSNLPLIGAHPEIAGLYVNVGHYRNGVLLAPGSARLLTDIMLQKQTIVQQEPFALDRIEAPK